MTGRSLQAQPRPTRHPARGQRITFMAGVWCFEYWHPVRRLDDGRSDQARFARWDGTMNANGFVLSRRFGSRSSGINRAIKHIFGPMYDFFADRGTS